MEIPDNNSVLTTNNAFFKMFNRIKDKTIKKESIDKEIEWIQIKLLSENAKISSNAVNLLVSLRSEIGHRIAFNILISSLQRLPEGTYEIVVVGIIQMLMCSECFYGINDHPLLVLLQENSEKMFFLSSKIVKMLKHPDE